MYLFRSVKEVISLVLFTVVLSPPPFNPPFLGGVQTGDMGNKVFGHIGNS